MLQILTYLALKSNYLLLLSTTETTNKLTVI